MNQSPTRKNPLKCLPVNVVWRVRTTTLSTWGWLRTCSSQVARAVEGENGRQLAIAKRCPRNRPEIIPLENFAKIVAGTDLQAETLTDGRLIVADLRVNIAGRVKVRSRESRARMENKPTAQLAEGNIT